MYCNQVIAVQKRSVLRTSDLSAAAAAEQETLQCDSSAKACAAAELGCSTLYCKGQMNVFVP
jgi:hypothetical protein